MTFRKVNPINNWSTTKREAIKKKSIPTLKSDNRDMYEQIDHDLFRNDSILMQTTAILMQKCNTNKAAGLYRNNQEALPPAPPWIDFDILFGLGTPWNKCCIRLWTRHSQQHSIHNTLSNIQHTPDHEKVWRVQYYNLLLVLISVRQTMKMEF